MHKILLLLTILTSLISCRHTYNIDHNISSSKETVLLDKIVVKNSYSDEGEDFFLGLKESNNFKNIYRYGNDFKENSSIVLTAKIERATLPELSFSSALIACCLTVIPVHYNRLYRLNITAEYKGEFLNRYRFDREGSETLFLLNKFEPDIASLTKHFSAELARKIKYDLDQIENIKD